MSTPHGERMKKAYRMTPRSRRHWVNQLLMAQEAVDKANDALTDVAAKAHEAGLSHAGIAGALGLHPTTVGGWLERRLEAQGDES